MKRARQSEKTKIPERAKNKEESKLLKRANRI